MELKYKVGEKVLVRTSINTYVGLIDKFRFTLVPTPQKDLYELGIISEEALYKYIMVDLLVNVNGTTKSLGVNMTRISKLEENNEMGAIDKSKVQVSLPVVPNAVKNNNVNLDIVDYKILNERAILFVFADGTTVTTVCSEEDKYNLEEAINVAICKKKFGGTSEYNNAIRKGIKQVKAIDLKREREAAEQKELERRRAKRLERKLRRKETKRQEQIDIQAEAFYRALQMCDDQLKDDDKITMKKLRRLFNTTK